MRRRDLALPLLVAVLAGPAGVAVNGRSAAQEGTPGAFAMPPGVSYDALAGAETSPLPAGPAMVLLARTELAPGASIPLAPDTSNYLVYVESGELTFHIDAPATVSRAVAGTPAAQAAGGAAPEQAAPQTDVVLKQGDSALFAANPSGAQGEARNDGKAPTVSLVIEVGPPMPAGTPAP